MSRYDRKGWGWLPVLTHSMEPLIRPGNQVLVSMVPTDKIRRGDIVVFRSGDELIVHRVLKRWQTANGVYFIEKGDRERTCQTVSANAVIGIANVVKGGSRIVNIGSSFARLISLLLAVALYWISTSINYLTASRNGTKKKINNMFSRLLFMFSRALIRICFLVWYPSEMFFRKKRV